jgi:hypothetical protein
MSEKTAGLVIIILLLCAGSVIAEEPADDGEHLPEILSYNESLFSDEFLFYEELFSVGELFPSDISDPSDEPQSLEESVLSDESFSSDEDLDFSEDFFLSEDSDLDEELYLSDNSLIFEAPPLVFEIPSFIYETRSFDVVFPGLSRTERRTALGKGGIKYFFDKDGSPSLIPGEDSGIDLYSSVMEKKPSHLIEAMVLVPYNKKEFDLLDIYNALGSIESLKDYSFLINDREVNIFEETTRIESARNRKSIPDPPPADILPYAQTMYLRFKDAYYGNLFIRGEVSMSLYGMTYSMTNFTDIRYFLVPIVRAERIIVIMYLEPLKEGVLVYSMSGLYLPGFIADRVNITPSINRRINTLINWITDGLRRQEDQ